METNRDIPAGEYTQRDFAYGFALSASGLIQMEWVAGAFESITGFSADEMRVKGWERLVHPKDRSMIPLRLGVLGTGSGDVREYRMLIADDGVRWVRDYAQPLGRNSDGSVRVIAAVQDISVRRKVNEELGRLSSIVDSLEDGMWDLTLDGVIVNWNRAAERIFGYSAEEVKGRTVTLLIPPERTGELQSILSRAQEGKVVHLETVRTAKNGRAVPVQLTATPVQDAAGRSVGASVVVRDLSELRHAESALRDSDVKTLSILNTVVDGVLTIDKMGTIDSINQAAQRLFGYSASEVVGHNVTMLMPEPYRSEHPQYLRNYMQTGKAKIIGIGREVVGLRKDRTTFPMDLAVSEARLGDRQLFTGIVRDLTERKRLERQILEISDREQSRIGQDLHDGLGQQLAGIGFLSKAMEQRLAARQDKETADARQIAALVSDAIAQARGLSHGLHPVYPTETGLMTALRELATTVEGTYRIPCVFECEKPALLKDTALAMHLYRIAQEAMNNALRHAEPQNVWISLSRTESTLTLSVRDDGHGLPEVLPEKKGMGLQTMRYRAALIGASISIGRPPSGGTRVDCILSLSEPRS